MTKRSRGSGDESLGFTSDWTRKWRETSDNSESLCNQIRVPNDKERGNAGFADCDLIGLVIGGNWFVFNLSQKVVRKKIKEKLKVTILANKNHGIFDVLVRVLSIST